MPPSAGGLPKALGKSTALTTPAPIVGSGTLTIIKAANITKPTNFPDSIEMIFGFPDI